MLGPEPGDARIQMLLEVEIQATMLQEKKWSARVVDFVDGPESGRPDEVERGGLGGLEGLQEPDEEGKQLAVDKDATAGMDARKMSVAYRQLGRKQQARREDDDEVNLCGRQNPIQYTYGRNAHSARGIRRG